MRRVVRLLAATAAGAAVLLSVAAAPGVQASGFAPKSVSIHANVAKMAILQVLRGHVVSFRYVPARGAAVEIPEALVYEVRANTAWKLTISTPPGVPVRVSLDGQRREAPGQGVAVSGEGPGGAAYVAGEAGTHVLTLSVRVALPPESAPGEYQIPVSVLLEAL